MSMSAGKMLLGLVVGISAGVLVGVLFAPAKGSVTRRKIARKGEAYVDSVKDEIDEYSDIISRKFEEIKEEIKDEVEKVKTLVESGKQNAKSSLS